MVNSADLLQYYKLNCFLKGNNHSSYKTLPLNVPSNFGWLKVQAELHFCVHFPSYPRKIYWLFRIRNGPQVITTVSLPEGRWGFGEELHCLHSMQHEEERFWEPACARFSSFCNQSLAKITNSVQIDLLMSFSVRKKRMM